MKYEQFAKDVIELVGGKDNIKKLSHCITRLRFILKDTSLAKTEEIKKLKETKNVLIAAGQYQVVIGTHVAEVYKDVVKVGNIEAGGTVPVDDGVDEEKRSLFAKFVNLITNVMMPAIMVLLAMGMINGFRVLFLQIGVLDDAGITNMALQAIGETMTHFFPIFIGYTAMKFFGGTPLIGLAIGAVLVHPLIGDIADMIHGNYLVEDWVTGYWSAMPALQNARLFGIPLFIPSQGYAGAVVPVIFSAYIAAVLEKNLKKITPQLLVMFVVPTLTILFTVVLTLLAVGPVIHLISEGISVVINWLIDLNIVVYSAFIGFAWMLLVMFGLHHALVAIMMIVMFGDPNFGSPDFVMYERILAPVQTHWFSLVGALLAMTIKTKQTETREIAVGASVAGIFGITEPGIYGAALPAKKPFLFALIGSAVGGLIMGVAGSATHQMAGLGIFIIPGFIHPDYGFTSGFWGFLIALPVAFAVSFLLTFFLWSEKNEEQLTM